MEARKRRQHLPHLHRSGQFQSEVGSRLRGNEAEGRGNEAEREEKA